MLSDMRRPKTNMADLERVLWFAETRAKISSLQVTCGIGNSSDINEQSVNSERVKKLTLDIYSDCFTLKNTSSTQQNQSEDGSSERSSFRAVFPLEGTRRSVISFTWGLKGGGKYKGETRIYSHTVRTLRILFNRSS